MTSYTYIYVCIHVITGTHTYIPTYMYTYIHTYMQVLPIVTLPLKDNYLTDKHVQGILDSVYPDMTPGASKTALFDIWGLSKRLLEVENISAEIKVRTDMCCVYCVGVVVVCVCVW
jgi:hypothetical protein